MSRKLRTVVPITREQRIPQVPDIDTLKEREKQLKDRQKRNFDKRHGVRDLPQLIPGDLVWMPDREEEAVVEEEVAPLSYDVSTSGGTLRRNRRNLVQLPDELPEEPNELENERDEEPSVDEQPPVRRSTRMSRPLERLDPSWS